MSGVSFRVLCYADTDRQFFKQKDIIMFQGRSRHGTVREAKRITERSWILPFTYACEESRAHKKWLPEKVRTLRLRRVRVSGGLLLQR